MECGRAVSGGGGTLSRQTRLRRAKARQTPSGLGRVRAVMRQLQVAGSSGLVKTLLGSVLRQ